MKNLNNKRENFVRLANIRTNGLLNKIRVLGNLSVKSRYAYSDEDINKIFSEIENALKLTRSRFKNKKINKNFKIE